MRVWTSTRSDIQPWTELARRTLPVAAGLAVAAWGLWSFARVVYELYGARVIDDAYITFRYAENWAAGDGLTWNRGEPPVEGYSTPLLVALLAAGRVVGIPVEPCARLIGVASALATLLVAGFLAWRVTESVAWALGAVGVLAANPVISVWGVSGMETAPYMALVTGAALALAGAAASGRHGTRRPWIVLGIVLALLALTRTEGPVFVAALGLLVLAEREDVLPVRPIIVVSVAVAALVLVHVGIRWMYYGTLFPLPVYKKGEPLAGLLIVTAFVRAYRLQLLLGVLALACEHGDSAKALRWGAVSLVLLSLVVLNVDSVMGQWHRYHAPVLPLVMVAAAVGLRHFVRIAWRHPVAIAAVVILCTGPTGLGLGLTAPGMLVQVHRYDTGLAKSHVALGHWLREHVPDRDATLVVSDCGVVPYYSGLRVVDLFGLNDAHIAQHGVDPDYVFGKRPELIVTSPLRDEAPLRDDARLGRDYVPVEHFDGLYRLTLWRRRDYALR